MPKPKKRNKILIFAIAILGIALACFLLYTSSLKAVSSKADPVVFEVKPGQSMNTVVDALAKQGVIRNGLAAKIHIKLDGKTTLRAGVFDLDKSWSTQQILVTLTKGGANILKVQLKEGDWARDMARDLGAAFGKSEKEFLDAWNDEAFVQQLIDKYEVLTPEILEHKKDVRVLLEGYLYPDTYNFDKTMSVADVTHHILKNTEAKYLEIKDKVATSKLSLHKLIKLSSIVMYEAASTEDQLMVAGVFHNRLDIDMLMQSSVTVCYALYDFDNWRDCELYKNQKIDSPYNTYIYKGLPVGPVLNPTQRAILNTVGYTHHDYLFFIADVYKGGNGKVYYSKTFKEHEKKRLELQNK